MLVQDPATAQILLMLASDDAAQKRQLVRDLKASKFAYFFASLDEREGLYDAAKMQIEQMSGKTPTVLVINFKFAGKETEALLELARAASRRFAIESVVTDPPSDGASRHTLTSLGARLFEGDSDRMSLEMTLH